MCTQRFYGRTNHAAVITGLRARLATSLGRREIADSLQRTVGRRLDAGALTVYYERPLTADSARRYLELAQRELAAIPGTGRGQRIVLVLLSDPERFRRRILQDGRLDPYRPRFERFAIGGADGACVVLMDIERHDVSSLLQQQRPAMLDWCALVARFGRPRRDVRRWVDPAFTTGWRDASSIAELIPAGRSASQRWVNDYEARACGAGSNAACLAFLGPRPGESWYVRRDIIRDFLAWLLATRPPEEFARFWRSEAPFADALTAGFGRPAGETIHAWARVRFSSQVRMAGATPDMVLAGAVWFSLALVAALVAMHRRQVG
jgi:hypothetical protein